MCLHDAKGRQCPLSEVSPMSLHGRSRNSFEHPLGIPRADKVLLTEVSPCFVYILTRRSLFPINRKRLKKYYVTILKKKKRKERNRVSFKRYTGHSNYCDITEKREGDSTWKNEPFFSFEISLSRKLSLNGLSSMIEFD